MDKEIELNNLIVIFQLQNNIPIPLLRKYNTVNKAPSIQSWVIYGFKYSDISRMETWVFRDCNFSNNYSCFAIIITKEWLLTVLLLLAILCNSDVNLAIV